MDIITYLLGIVLDIIGHIILMGMGGGSQVLITLKIAFSNFYVLFLFVFLRKSCNFFVYFLAAYQFRKNSGHCSCVSQIGFVGTPSPQQTGL